MKVQLFAGFSFNATFVWMKSKMLGVMWHCSLLPIMLNVILNAAFLTFALDSALFQLIYCLTFVIIQEC